MPNRTQFKIAWKITLYDNPNNNFGRRQKRKPVINNEKYSVCWKKRKTILAWKHNQCCDKFFGHHPHVDKDSWVWMQASLGTAARYLGVSTTQSPSKEISAKEESLRFSPKLRINQNVTQKVGQCQTLYFTTRRPLFVDITLERDRLSWFVDVSRVVFCWQLTFVSLYIRKTWIVVILWIISINK